MKTLFVYPSTETVYTETPLQTLEAKVSHQGITLRDHFAGLAMQSMLVADGTTNFETRARESYQVADAMLKMRDEPEIEP